MTDRCESLHTYVDGELGSDDHVAFEAHLSTCHACSTELPRLLVLLATLDAAAEAASGVPATGPRLTLVTGASADPEGHPPRPHHAHPDAGAPCGSPSD